MNAKKVNKNAVEVVTAPIMPEKNFKKSNSSFKVETRSNAHHLHNAQCEVTKQDTEKAISVFFHGGDVYGIQAATFTALEWYKEQERQIHELRLARELERKRIAGLLSCPVPQEWTVAASNKTNRLLASMASWLITLCREYQKDDCYQLDVADVADELPAYNKRGLVLGQTEKSKLFHATVGKLVAPLLPLVDVYTGEYKRAPFTACKLQIERVKHTDSYLFSFNA